MIVRKGFVSKVALATAVMLTVALVSYAPAAQASTYDFSGIGVSLDITTGSPDNGGFDITSATGTVLGDPVSLAGGNPGSAGAISSDGAFIYDNILYPTSNPVIDWYGLLLQDVAKNPQFLYANIFGDSAGLLLYTSFQGGYPVQNNSYSGTLTGPAATPLPPTWTMLLAGFVCLGFLSYRGTKKPTFGQMTA
jgi:hypothetical protein